MSDAIGPLAERVARESYGKLVAILAARSRDIAAAEDALSEAFAAALATWPVRGAPANPEAWLLTAARNRLADLARRAQTAQAGQAQLLQNMDEVEAEMGQLHEMPDRRLGLLFACAHPALDSGVRTALMLQTVLGLSAERIAKAFLAEPAAIGQRLVRAKAKIKAAGIGFSIPPREAWPERLPPVLDAIYAGYAEAWVDATGADPVRRDLSEEAIWLCRLLVLVAPDEPEALGLLSLLLHLDARRPARRSPNGDYVPLEAQDAGLWRRDLQQEAEQALLRAARFARPGRYQLEAAIQSAHAARAWRGEADWAAIAGLYAFLVRLTGSPVAQLNHAASLARTEGGAAGLAALDRLEDTLVGYQPYWALRAHLLAETGRHDLAVAAFAEAIAREPDPAVIAFLQKRLRASQAAVEAASGGTS